MGIIIFSDLTGHTQALHKSFTNNQDQAQTFCCIRLMAKFSKMLRIHFENWQNPLGFQVQLGSGCWQLTDQQHWMLIEPLQALPLTNAQSGEVLAFFTLHFAFQGISEERWGQNFRKKKNQHSSNKAEFKKTNELIVQHGMHRMDLGTKLA